MKATVVAVVALSGCASWNSAVTGFVGANGDNRSNDSGWNAGVAFGFSQTNSFVAPPNFNHTRVNVNNHVSVGQYQNGPVTQNNVNNHVHNHHNDDDDDNDD